VTPDDPPFPHDDPPGNLVALTPRVRVPASALRFSAVRASGPGGQNVNKVSTKIELRLSLRDLPISLEALDRLRRLAGRRVTAEDDLILTESGSRSQSANRDAAIERLRDLVAAAVIAPKPRIATKPSKGSKRRRIEGKKRRADTKRLRGRPSDE
jgi:ribosome-associated protein